MSLDRLEEFASEATLRGRGASISVHDLIARGTPVSWDEGVAIVEEMCAVAISMSGDEAPVPALADLLLAADGRVAISRGRSEEGPVAAGRVLHAVLANAEVPVPLRLFVTQSVASGTHGSLQEFAAGLAYYGRPNRMALLQDVYKRAAALVKAGVAPTFSLPPLPIEEKATPKKSQESKRLNTRRALLWTAAFVLIAAAGTAGWAWLSTGSRNAVVDGRGVLSQASAALTDFAKQVGDRLKPAASTDTKVPSVISATDSRPRPARRVATPAVVEEQLLTVRQLPMAAPDAWQIPAAVPTVSIPVATASPLVVESEEVPAPSEVERLFTKQDTDVRPPLLQYPQLAPPLRSVSPRQAPINRVELVVAADGTVERARFVAGPVRMMDIMLVGNIKTWKFTPASKDGEPVRYQTVISWAAVP